MSKQVETDEVIFKDSRKIVKIGGSQHVSLEKSLVKLLKTTVLDVTWIKAPNGDITIKMTKPGKKE